MKKMQGDCIWTYDSGVRESHIHQLPQMGRDSLVIEPASVTKNVTKYFEFASRTLTGRWRGDGYSERLLPEGVVPG